jgi:hypothetical protein
MLTYSLIIDKTLNMKKKYILDKLDFVLSNKKGWKKLGYKFKYIDDIKDIDILIYISPNDYIDNVCGFDKEYKLSCAVTQSNKPNKGIIYLNVDNWRNGSKLSKLCLQDYRNYMVNHEIGHILGRDHLFAKDYKNKLAPVMIQQTKGIENCIPNCWPLVFE